MDLGIKWLCKLGERLGIPNLAFDAEGVCVLRFDRELVVFIYNATDTDNLLLFAQLPTSALSEHIMQQMLIENRRHRTGTAPVLSLSENLSYFEIHLKLSQCELEGSEDIIGQFLENLEYWNTNLKHH